MLVKNKIQDNGSFVFDVGPNKNTIGILFAYNSETNDYCIYSFSYIYQTSISHTRLAGNLEITWSNQYGSVTIDGATDFVTIYIEK